MSDWNKRFFENFEFEGLTFEDISIVPQDADFLPDEADITTKLTRNMTGKSPFWSAAMDTVTEHEMAIAMAMMGGIGAIHKNLSPKDQAREVARVKHYLNARIDNPIWVSEDQTMEFLMRRRERKGYKFHSFPVVDVNGRVVGVLTERDFKFCTDPNQLVKEHMSPNPITGNIDTTLSQAYKLMESNGKIETLPLVDERGMLVGMYVLSDVIRVSL